MSIDMLKNHLHSTVDRIISNKKTKNSGFSESKVVKSHERNLKKSVNYIGRHVYSVLRCRCNRR
jgi:hypothetical protein